MELSAKVSGNVLICSVKGELDHHTAKEFRAFMDYNMENNPVRHLLLDLTELSFMDSSGVGAMIGRYKKIDALGGKMAVVNESRQVSKVFEVSGMYDIISSYCNISKAMSDF